MLLYLAIAVGCKNDVNHIGHNIIEFSSFQQSKEIKLNYLAEYEDGEIGKLIYSDSMLIFDSYESDHKRYTERGERAK